MDEKTLVTFAQVKLREDQLERVICPHCKRAILKQGAKEHMSGCLKAKQEKARKKKEARDAANRAKEKATNKDGDDKAEDAAGAEKVGDGDDVVSGQKSAKKSAVKGMTDDGPKKGKKRKADADDDKEKEPKKKKKKEEPKPKVPKPKGPVDVEKQCGVTLANGMQCARSLTCKSHSMGAKRAVPGRSLPYDMLLQAYQKKNQARQQSKRLEAVLLCRYPFLSRHRANRLRVEAAIDANAPLQDDYDNNGPVDSDEERDAVMAAISRSCPRPLVTHTLVPTRKKYQYVRMKEMLSHVLGGARGGGLFSIGDPTNLGGRTLFAATESPVLPSPTAPEVSNDSSKKSVTASQGAHNRSTQNSATNKAILGTSS
jgi:SAGA-associated factor 73